MNKAVIVSLFIVSSFLTFLTNNSYADEQPPLVKIADPFINIHSGPGRGFPVIHVAEQGEVIRIIKRRTDWYQIETVRGVTGWSKRIEMSKTLNLDGSQVEFKDATVEDFENRTWEAGFSTGDLEGASILSLYGAYHFTENLSTELTYSQAIGNFSDNSYALLSLTHQPFPEWWISPFFTIGAGVLNTEPHATLIETEDRQNEMLSVGLGTRIYISQSFILRLDVKNNTVLTSRDENEELIEWKLGISVFF